MRDSFCWSAFSALSGLQSDVMLCRTWELYSKQDCKLRFWVRLPYVYVYSRYLHIYFLCMCSYNLVVTLSLCQEHRSLRGYGLPSVQEVTQYWLALHFLWADSPLLLSGCLPPPPPPSPSPFPPPSSITWLYVGTQLQVRPGSSRFSLAQTSSVTAVTAELGIMTFHCVHLKHTLNTLLKNYFLSSLSLLFNVCIKISLYSRKQCEMKDSWNRHKGESLSFMTWWKKN